MPSAARCRLAAMADLARQYAFAPAATRTRILTRAEAFIAEIEPDREYPLAFVVFRLSGYRSEADGDLLVGADLRGDLARLVTALSKGLGLTPASRPEGALEFDAAAAAMGVSIRSLHRWRAEGLCCHWIDFGSGEAKLGCFRAALDAFSKGHQPRVERAAAYRRLDADARDQLAARFRHHRRLGCSPTAAAAAVAAELGRSRESVRLALIDSGAWARRQTRRGAEAFRTRLLQAWDLLMPLAVFARHEGRELRAVAAECRRLRAARLREIELPSRHFPTFERADAARVIPFAPIAQRGFAEQWMPLDAVVLVDSARRMRAAFDAAETLLAVEAWHLREAQSAQRSLRTTEAAIDELETRLRWAAGLRRRAVRAVLPLAVSRIEQVLGGPLLARTAEEVRVLLAQSFEAIGTALDRYEPTVRGGPTRSLRGVLTLAIDRQIAAIASGLPVRRAAARHARIDLADFTLQIAPWFDSLRGPERLRVRTLALPAQARDLLLQRFGWGDGPPASIESLRSNFGGSRPLMSRRLSDAAAALGGPRRGRESSGPRPRSR